MGIWVLDGGGMFGGRIQIPKCVKKILLLMLGLLEPPRLDYLD